MRNIANAIRHVYSLDMGKKYDKTLLKVLEYYRRGGAAMAISLLRTPEMYGDPCAKALREYAGIEGSKGGSPMFSFCQAKRDRAPDWIKDHGWRINRWPDFLPYIHPTETK